MKNKLFFVFLPIVLMSMVIIFGSCTKIKAQTRPERWEYYVIPGTTDFEQLNSLGAGGWELVTETNFGDGILFYFKRKL